MANPSLRFVESPDVGASVRLDLHQAGCWTDPREWEWGTPPLLGDPDGRGVAYGLRTVRFTWYVEGTKSQALSRLSDLAREIMRDDNYLLFQVDPSGPPAWFELARSEPGAPSMRWVRTDSETDVWAVDVSLLAEPFILGTREEFTVTVANDPAASGGLGVVLPEIKGDAPTPLVLRSNNVRSWGTTIISVGTRAALVSSGDPMGQPTVSDAAYSGGTATRVTISPFFENNDVIYLLLPPAGWNGRGKLFVRVRRVSGTADVQLWASANGVDGERKVLPNSLGTTNPTLIDLGSVALTPGVDGYDHPAANKVRVTGTTTGTVDVEVDVDYMIYVPEARSSATITTAQTPSAARFVVDGEQEYTAWLTNDYPAYPIVKAGVRPPSLTGGFPAVAPGEDNVLWVQTNPTTHPLADVSTFACSYRPRWLYMAAS